MKKLYLFFALFSFFVFVPSSYAQAYSYYYTKEGTPDVTVSSGAPFVSTVPIIDTTPSFTNYFRTPPVVIRREDYNQVGLIEYFPMSNLIVQKLYYAGAFYGYYYHFFTPKNPTDKIKVGSTISTEKGILTSQNHRLNCILDNATGNFSSSVNECKSSYSITTNESLILNGSGLVLENIVYSTVDVINTITNEIVYSKDAIPTPIEPEPEPLDPTDGFMEVPSLFDDPTGFINAIFQNIVIFLKNIILPSEGYFSTKFEEIRNAFDAKFVFVSEIRAILSSNTGDVTQQELSADMFTFTFTPTGETYTLISQQTLPTFAVYFRNALSALIYFLLGMFLLVNGSKILKA